MREGGRGRERSSGTYSKRSVEVWHGVVASMVDCGMSREISVEVSVEFSVCVTLMMCFVFMFV